MTIDDLSRLAYSGTPPDSAMPYEWLLWHRLRDIYSKVRDGSISKADGAKQKEQAVNSYQTDKSLYDASVQLWMNIEQAGIQYAKDKTIANADAFYAAVYGIKPGLPERIKNSQKDVETSEQSEQSQAVQDISPCDGDIQNEANQPERAVK